MSTVVLTQPNETEANPPVATTVVKTPDGKVVAKEQLLAQEKQKAEEKVQQKELAAEKKETADEVAKKVAAAERKARERDKEIKRMQSEKEALAKEAEQLRHLRSISKEDPFKALESIGVTMDDLIEASMPDTPEKKARLAEKRIEQKIKSYEDSIKQREQQAQQAEFEAAVERGRSIYFGQMDELLSKDDGDRWEVVKTLAPSDRAMIEKDAFDLMNLYYEKHGTLPDHASVLDALEKDYLDTADNAPARVVKASKKLQDKLNGLFTSDFDKAKAADKAKRSSVLDSPKAKQKVSAGGGGDDSGPPKKKPGEDQNSFRRRLVDWGQRRIAASKDR